MRNYAGAGLIEADELAFLLKSGGSVKLLDATYPSKEAARIGDAGVFDIDAVADPRSDMPHMLPSPGDFARAVLELGISNDDLVVVYDQSGIAMAAARAWWMFRVFGHDNVCVLNGGLPYWKATGHPLNDSPPAAPAAVKYTASFRPELVRDMALVQQALRSGGGTAILDARSTERFSGNAAESRPGLRSGHIPGSANVPYASLIDPSDGRLRAVADIRGILDAFAGKQVIASCGSGVTACVIALAFYTLEKPDVAVYDGSWTEWGRKDRATEVTILT